MASARDEGEYQRFEGTECTRYGDTGKLEALALRAETARQQTVFEVPVVMIGTPRVTLFITLIFC
jgi:hypothetical protein